MKNNLSKEDIEFLFSPQAIRESTLKLFKLTEDGKTNFNLHLEKLEEVVEFVINVIDKAYPDYDIPFHSRWNHFNVGDVNRVQKLEKVIKSDEPLERARKKIDLVITSVLLDAGAGKSWSYQNNEGTFDRSEGLAVASFDLFMSKRLSSDGRYKADAQALKKFSKEELKKAFQVSEKNPLVGVEGRVELLNNLGECILDKPKFFPSKRPGSIIDFLIKEHGYDFEVKDILSGVLIALGDIWPGRIKVDNVNLGDVWHYRQLGEDISKESLVCFHKLSQWLTYSLVSPMEEAGLKISGAEKLTGLAEYRNGGLFLDMGVISLKDSNMQLLEHKPESELIIEWRALTICLLDLLAEKIQSKLEMTSKQFPLAKVLEGGTWAAGREVAKRLRKDGAAPLTLSSDGTVF